MIRLVHGPLEALVNPQGAELASLRLQGNEYLWSGDARFWGKQSPVLFPIVGALQDGRYRFQGACYCLPRHGFARDRTFAVKVLSDQEVICSLEDDEASRLVYPFRFHLRIRYFLHAEVLHVEYTVANPSDVPLFFSIGGHPAFALPLEPGLAYDDYQIEFSHPETVGRWKLRDGLLLQESPGFLQGATKLPLHHELFVDDAIVLQGLRSSYLTLRSSRGSRGLRFGIKDWPHLGLWAPAQAPFVCIEPWQGHADPYGYDGELANKPGIVTLAQGDCWERSWTVQPFI